MRLLSSVLTRRMLEEPHAVAHAYPVQNRVSRGEEVVQLGARGGKRSAPSATSSPPARLTRLRRADRRYGVVRSCCLSFLEYAGNGFGRAGDRFCQVGNTGEAVHVILS